MLKWKKGKDFIKPAFSIAKKPALLFTIYTVSRGSTGEVRSQSYRAFDNKYIPEEKFNELLERTDSLSRKIYNLMQHLKNSDIKGLKYI